MAKDNLKTKFYKFIYLLDKENNKEEGKDTPDFDTWLKELKKEENNNLKKQKKFKKKMTFGQAMSSLAKDTKNKSNNKKTYTNDYQRFERKNQESYNEKKVSEKKLYKKPKQISKNQIEDYWKENEKIKLEKNELKKAIIYSEIIGKPKAKRWEIRKEFLIFFMLIRNDISFYLWILLTLYTNLLLVSKSFKCCM